MIRERDAPHFGVVFRGNHDFHARRDARIETAEVGLVFRKRDMVRLRFAPRWLMAGGPDCATAHVPQVNKRTPVVSGNVFTPACDGVIFALRVTRTSGRDHHAVSAIRKQLRARRVEIGRLVNAREHARHGLYHASSQNFFGTGVSRRHADGDALLQEQLCCLNCRIGMKASWTRIFLEQVCQRHDAHSLVVRHERTNQHRLLSFRQTFCGVVDRLVESIWTKCAFLLQAAQIADRRRWIDAQRQHRRVRRDDEILDQSALQAETGHAEWTVLIVEMKVAYVVRGFRYAPGHAALFAVLDLAVDDRSISLPQQRCRIVLHNQKRHQVLEHRAGP